MPPRKGKEQCQKPPSKTRGKTAILMSSPYKDQSEDERHKLKTSQKQKCCEKSQQKTRKELPQKIKVPQLLHAYFETVCTANVLLVKTGFSVPCASNGPMMNAVAMKKNTISSVVFALSRPD
ncbi:hypothetical protein PR048_005330, partial [Dryococelus australis]